MPTPADRPPRLGVVLAGTGVRGFAQAGTLGALDRAGLSPDVLVGVSSAAVVAATYAVRTDWSAALLAVDRARLPTLSAPLGDDVRSRLRQTLRSARQLAPSVWTWGRKGLEGLGRDVLEDLFGSATAFADTRLPLALTATDLRTSSRVTFTEGALVDAAVAASALPGLTRPVQVAGRVLLDGAFADPAPVDVARALGADVVVVALPFGPGEAHGGATDEEFDGPIAAMLRGLVIGQRAFLREQLSDADIVLRADLGEDVRLLDFTVLDDAVRRAYEDTLEAADVLAEALAAAQP